MYDAHQRRSTTQRHRLTRPAPRGGRRAASAVAPRAPPTSAPHPRHAPPPQPPRTVEHPPCGTAGITDRGGSPPIGPPRKRHDKVDRRPKVGGGSPPDADD